MQITFSCFLFQKSEALTYKNGLPTSMKNSGQQWDFPNGWAPLQHMVIEGKGEI